MVLQRSSQDFTPPLKMFRSNLCPWVSQISSLNRHKILIFILKLLILRKQHARLLTLSQTLTFTRHLSETARSQIQTAVKRSPVVLFIKCNPSRSQCGSLVLPFRNPISTVYQKAKWQHTMFWKIPSLEWVSRSICEYRLHLIVRGYNARTLSEWPTIPQLFVDGELVGSFNILIESLLYLTSIDIRISNKPSSAQVWWICHSLWIQGCCPKITNQGEICIPLFSTDNEYNPLECNSNKAMIRLGESCKSVKDHL